MIILNGLKLIDTSSGIVLWVEEDTTDGKWNIVAYNILKPENKEIMYQTNEFRVARNKLHMIDFWAAHNFKAVDMGDE
jgi:hypothetical protein